MNTIAQVSDLNGTFFTNFTREILTKEWNGNKMHDIEKM